MISLTGQSIDLDQLWQVAHTPFEKFAIESECRKKVLASREFIEKGLKGQDAIYGVNTGFGIFSKVRIKPSDIAQLQVNILRSHACGVGAPFSPQETRAIMFLRANTLARGHSGVRLKVIEKILEFLEEGITPVVPQQGSVGASGDLAPLAHLALALIGEGEVWGEEGKAVAAAEILKRKKIEPLVLEAKEGLSLINGCQVMTGVGLMNAYEARRLHWMMDVAAALTVEALRGSRKAFDPIIFETRPHPGEAKTARNLLKLLGGESEISCSHVDCDRVQDAYSIRCTPAVHGAAKDAVRNGIVTLEIEANSSTDNPLVFSDERKILSCGNFHGEPVAFALDFMAIAMSALGSISECRIEKLMKTEMSGLPVLLAPNGGLNSGLMMVQVAAASLVSENKILSHPASVDSIPTNADKEDHVSMGTIAARKFGQIIRNAENIAAMELLCACQALDFLKPLKPSPLLQGVYGVIRERVPFAEVDRILSRDIEEIKILIRDETLIETVERQAGELEW